MNKLSPLDININDLVAEKSQYFKVLKLDFVKSDWTKARHKISHAQDITTSILKNWVLTFCVTIIDNIKIWIFK